MRPSTSMRLPLTCMTATARFCPCLLASSSSRTSFSRCSIILRCLSIRQKKSHRVPSQSRDGGCDQRASRFASSLWPVNGKRGFKTTRGLHWKSGPANDSAHCACCRSDRPLLPSGHLNSVNFHRVTSHFEFGVSPLEIGGIGTVPPSPPHKRKARYLKPSGLFLSRVQKTNYRQSVATFAESSLSPPDQCNQPLQGWNARLSDGWLALAGGEFSLPAPAARAP